MVRLFAHRGFTAELHPQNSVASLKEAVNNSFDAVEFDLWFMAHRLVLKHDRPLDDEVQTLPTLREKLICKNYLTYWFDFKNLDEENSVRALMLAKREVEHMEVDPDQIYFAPFITNTILAEKIFMRIRDIFGQKSKIMAVCKELKNDEATINLRRFLDRNNIKYLSILHSLINQNSLAILAGVEIFAWTVNDMQRLKELEALGVTNFATDKITPQIYESFRSPQTR